jgi:hypothetical protein
MKIVAKKHFIRAPATNKTNDVGINTSAEEGHSTPSTETAGGDMLGVNAKSEVEGGGAEAEHGRDAGGGNKSRAGGRMKKKEKKDSRREGS